MTFPPVVAASSLEEDEDETSLFPGRVETEEVRPADILQQILCGDMDPPDFAGLGVESESREDAHRENTVAAWFKMIVSDNDRGVSIPGRDSNQSVGETPESVRKTTIQSPCSAGEEATGRGAQGESGLHTRLYNIWSSWRDAGGCGKKESPRGWGLNGPPRSI